MSRRFCDTILNDRDALRVEVARLTAERDSMRAVVDAAETWRDAETDDGDCLTMSDLMCAVDALRASKAGR